MKKPERKQYAVSPERFVEAWETCDTIDEVAKKLRLQKDGNGEQQ